MTSNTELIKVFEFALGQEQTGKSFFQTSLDRMGIGAARSAFERLIEEEDKHIRFITAILDNLKKGEDIDLSSASEEDSGTEDFFDARSKSEFLERCVQESMVPDVTVFNTAWLIEKDLSDYYQRMADQTEGRAKQALEMLARWEKGHERFFREFRDKLSEVYATMPWGG
jgi:rubrerythrin